MKEANAPDSSFSAQPQTPLFSSPGGSEIPGLLHCGSGSGFFYTPPHFPLLNTVIHFSTDMKTRMQLFDGFLRLFLARTLKKGHTHVQTHTPTRDEPMEQAEEKEKHPQDHNCIQFK